MRWVGGLICGLGVAAYAFALVGFVALTVLSAVYMLMAVIQSVAASKTGSKPMISDRFFILYFYMLMVPFMHLLIAWGAYDGAEEVLELGFAALNILIIFTAYLALRHRILPLLMRRTSLSGHAHAAAVLSIILWPCYGIPLYKIGLHQMVYEAATSLIGCASVD